MDRAKLDPVDGVGVGLAVESPPRLGQLGERLGGCGLARRVLDDAGVEPVDLL